MPIFEDDRRQIPIQRRNRTFPFEQNDVSVFAALYKPVIALQS
jgi:hypothetical protein